jgi:hypothetical protein
MARTASTMSGVSFSARVWLSFVEREVRATHINSSRSTSLSSLNVSRNYAGCLATADIPKISTHLQRLRLSNLVAVCNDSWM